MAIQTAEDFFLTGLSDLHQSEQRLGRAVEELSQQVQDPDVKNLLSARAFLTQQDVANIEKCFQLLGKQPVQVGSKFRDTWIDDVRRELNEIQNPVLRTLYALNKVRVIQDFHIGEYLAVTNMAEFMGNDAVALLLEHNLSDKVDFVERTRDVVREYATQAIGTRIAGRAAA